MIVFVSCVGRKLEYSVAAQDRYQSAWFRKARAYAERYGDRWFILSAKYGLIESSKVIAPYDQTLNDMRKLEREVWADNVMINLTELSVPIPDGAHIQVLAGRRYREFLVPRLEQAGYAVEVPMEGLGIGQQLAWLKRQIEESDRKLSVTGNNERKIMSKIERFHEIKTLLNERESNPPFAYFIMNSYGGIEDEGLDFCWDCLIKRLPENCEPGEHWGGGYAMESDSVAICEDCGRILDYILTDYGLDNELEIFAQSNPVHLDDADECFQLACIANGLLDRDTERITKFLTLFA